MKFLSFSFAVLALGAAGVLATPFGVSARKKTTLQAAAKPLYFGAALGQGHLQNTSDTMFKKLAKQQFSGATPENEMKWEIIEPEQDQFDFGPGDFIAGFANSNNMVLRGHTLVWHNQLAPFVSNLTGNALLKAMKNHITTVMTHYKGHIYGWDVVNEAFNDDGTLGASPFLSQIGPDYIKIAFQTARKADPNAKLYINDFNTEGINNKSNALLSLVQSLKAENLIDGVGFQSHFIIGELPPDLQANLQRFVDAGVEVAITELDIRTELPLTAALETQQSTDYTTVINACQAVEKCVGVTTWGITDLYSWIPGTFPGQGGALLWDDSYNEKPSFQATLSALQ